MMLSGADPAREPSPPAADEDGVAEPRPSAALDFAAVYEQHFDFLWRSVRRLGVADAHVDDVVQEVLLTVHRRLGSFEGRSSLKTWLFGIALGVVRNHRRVARRQATHTTPADEVPEGAAADRPSEPGPHASLVKAEAVRILYDILDELSDDKRAVFILAELEQVSGPEIAALLSVNVNTVYARLRAARSEFEASVARRKAQDGWRYR
jgi:RNA polymerase sigma-70 factor (ECF subfamily)